VSRIVEIDLECSESSYYSFATNISIFFFCALSRNFSWS